mmetsp:Transcript_6770/g.23640  ORF Transcript_6770/g.23640 Transcript_6770/m.23640 type:complete len:105 (-) Transcript_6770:1047-1361(-)
MVSSDEFSNLYDVLGLHEGASEKEIRRAYRNLATREHPDKGGDEEKFKHIQRAYEILSDASKVSRRGVVGLARDLCSSSGPLNLYLPAITEGYVQRDRASRQDG